MNMAIISSTMDGMNLVSHDEYIAVQQAVQALKLTAPQQAGALIIPDVRTIWLSLCP